MNIKYFHTAIGCGQPGQDQGKQFTFLFSLCNPVITRNNLFYYKINQHHHRKNFIKIIANI